MSEVPAAIHYSGEYCGSCSYCCWSLAVVVPLKDLCGSTLKSPSETCPWVAPLGGGCSLHSQPQYPASCRGYVCPYALLESDDPRSFLTVQWPNGAPFPFRVHRPDRFQGLLSMFQVPRSVMPLVPLAIPPEEAIRLVIDTGSIMAAEPDHTLSGFVGRHVVSIQLLRSGALPSIGRWNDLLVGYCRPLPRYLGIDTGAIMEDESKRETSPL